MKKNGILWLAVIGFFILSACVHSQQVKPEHLRLMPASLAKRQLQTRIFDTENESELLAACAAVLQDIGFRVDESERPVGLIVGSKERSAVQPGEIVGKIILAIPALGKYEPEWDVNQIMRISLVVTPIIADQKGTAVRVNFQRIVFTNKGFVSKRETWGTPEIYQEFFASLAKNFFLTAHPVLPPKSLALEEPSKLIEKPAPTRTSDTLSLRKEPEENLKEIKIKDMLFQYGFYDSQLNPDGACRNHFIDNQNGTITDLTTGLMWERSGSRGVLRKNYALAYVKDLNNKNFSGYSD